MNKVNFFDTIKTNRELTVEQTHTAAYYIDDGYMHFRNFHGRLCAIKFYPDTTDILVGICIEGGVGYQYRYSYKTLTDAQNALNEWDGIGPPSGFIKRTPNFIRPMYPRKAPEFPVDERIDTGAGLDLYLQSCKRCNNHYMIETLSRDYCDNCGFVMVDYWGVGDG